MKFVVVVLVEDDKEIRFHRTGLKEDQLVSIDISVPRKCSCNESKGAEITIPLQELSRAIRSIT